jgi:hypothetical protein
MPDRVMRAALEWFALTTVIFWLPAIRGLFDGPSYQWGLFGFRGRGVSGDYWFPLVGVCGALAVLAGGWRRRRWPFDILSAWSVLLFVAAIEAAASSPDDFRFRGDTLGIDVSLAWVGPVLCGAAIVLSLVAAWRVHRHPSVEVAGWHSRNSRWLALLVAALPFQFLLLRFGGIESLSDKIGVLLTIAQWFMVSRVFRPYRLADAA